MYALQDTAKLLFEGCVNYADNLAPEQILEVLNIYAFLCDREKDEATTAQSGKPKKEEEQIAYKW
jgi:hypothetical protein